MKESSLTNESEYARWCAEVVFLVGNPSTCFTNVLRVVDQGLDGFYACHVSDDHLAKVFLMSFVFVQGLFLHPEKRRPRTKACRSATPKSILLFSCFGIAKVELIRGESTFRCYGQLKFSQASSLTGL
jgi:hypothetical protein